MTEEEFLTAQRLGLLSMNWEYRPDGVYVDGEYRQDGVYTDGSGDYEPPFPTVPLRYWILGKYRFQGTPQHWMADEELRLHPRSSRRPVLCQTHEYHECWPLVDVTLELFPDVGFDSYRQDENVVLRVTIRESLTEQEKSIRRDEIHQWEEEALRKARFRVWKPDKDDYFRKLKEMEDWLRQDLQNIADGGFGPSIMPPNIADDPERVQALIDLRSIDNLLRSRGLSIERPSDLEELMVHRHLMFLSSSWPDDPSELVEFWRALQREQKQGWTEEVQGQIKQVQRDQKAHARLMRMSDRKTRASILRSRAHEIGYNRRQVREVEQVFRMGSLNEATSLAAKMLERGGVDTFYYEKFWPLKEFRRFNEVFRENFDLRYVEPDEEDQLGDRVREMFR